MPNVFGSNTFEKYWPSSSSSVVASGRLWQEKHHHQQQQQMKHCCEQNSKCNQLNETCDSSSDGDVSLGTTANNNQNNKKNNIKTKSFIHHYSNSKSNILAHADTTLSLSFSPLSWLFLSTKKKVEKNGINNHMSVSKKEINNNNNSHEKIPVQQRTIIHHHYQHFSMMLMLMISSMDQSGSFGWLKHLQWCSPFSFSFNNNNTMIHCKSWRHWNTSIFIILILMMLSTPVCLCIKVVSLNVPSHVRRGSDLELSCLFDLGNATLYSLKWFYRAHEWDREEQEFFRYTPRHKPYKQVFPLEGIQVDLSKSSGSVVYIRQANSKTSGKYKCEISVEETFQTVAAEKLMTVLNSYCGPKLSDNLHYYYLLPSLFSLIFTRILL